MTYEQMMSIGEACGLTTVGECYNNVELHYDAFFKIENVNEEFLKLQKDICKKNPQGFMEVFSVSQDLVNKWNREEINK